MKGSPETSCAALLPLDQLRLGRQVLQQEATALLALARQLDATFCRAVDLLYHCRGSVIVSGMGKAGLIGQKIAATLASTGTRSHFLHPAEAMHGDLGRIHPDDVALLLSHSGETEEVLRLLPSLQEMHVSIVAVTGESASRLAQAATVCLPLGQLEEADRLKLAPSTSTTAMLALGDALALVTSQRRGFVATDFARFHPGGSLGRKLARVDQVMRPLEQCRVADQGQTVRQLLVAQGRPGRRTGAVLLTDQQGQLVGIFTDSDLARLLEQQRDAELDQPVHQVMTRAPVVVRSGTRMSDALALLVQRKISELPVVDNNAQPVGMIDVTDLMEYLPRETGPEGQPSDRPDRTFRTPVVPHQARIA